MSFVLQRVTPSGSVLTQIRTDALRIGRGTNAELRSENPAVALEHAVIESVADGYVVVDRGSITGTYVNGKPVESARLAKGDRIDIGDLKLEVQIAEPGKPLFLRIISAPAASAAGEKKEQIEAEESLATGGAVRAKAVDFAGAYRLGRPYLSKLTLIAILLIVALIVVATVTTPEGRGAFMPGGLSSVHARARDAHGESIANECDACHLPWRGVSNAKCESCHAKHPHAAALADTLECASCHPEHRGSNRLALATNSRCIDCHRDVRRHTTRGVILAGNLEHITSFAAQHPEFTYPPDDDILLFNHALHLQKSGIFNGAGEREVLTCTNCHTMVPSASGRIDPAPVRFAAHCQRCHELTFDPRFPHAAAPHGGDPGLVYGFVMATYAGGGEIVNKSPSEVRRLLATRPAVAPDARGLLLAEQVIKTKCTLCHQLVRSEGKLAVTPPTMRRKWLSHTTFTHTPHRAIDCTQCHAKALSSTLTSDRLLPQRSACLACHGVRAGREASPCVTCHEYHERSNRVSPDVADARPVGPTRVQ